MPEKKSEFENTTGGYIGAQVKNHNGQMKGVSVRPGHTIWLDEDEQIATANAPRRDEDNPFEGDPPHLKLITAAKDIANRRPIGHTERPQVSDPGVRDEAPPAAEEPQASADGGDGGQSSDAEEAAPAAPEEPPTPPAEPPAAEPKPEAEMSEEEKREHNAKAAAERAVPPAGTPKPSKAKAAKPAAAPKGERAPTEQVATPQAEGK